MITANDMSSSSTESPKEQFQNNIGEIQEAVKDLKEDVVRLVDNTVDATRNSVGAAKEQACDAVNELRHYGSSQTERVANIIRQRPFRAVAIAFVAGCVWATLRR